MFVVANKLVLHTSKGPFLLGIRSSIRKMLNSEFGLIFKPNWLFNILLILLSIPSVNGP